MRYIYLIIFVIFFFLGLFLSGSTLNSLECQSLKVTIIVITIGAILGYIFSKYFVKAKKTIILARFTSFIVAGVGLGSILNSMYNNYSVCFSLFYLMSLPFFISVGWSFMKEK